MELRIRPVTVGDVKPLVELTLQAFARTSNRSGKSSVRRSTVTSGPTGRPGSVALSKQCARTA